MKSIIISVTLMAAAIQAVPLQDGLHSTITPTTEAPVLNGTHLTPVNNCSITDLDKIEEKIIQALDKQIAQLLGGHHSKKHRSTRATSSAGAISSVGPDGTVNSAAGAKGSNDPAPVSTAAPILTNGHQLAPVMDATRKLPEEGSGAPGASDLPAPPPMPVGGQSAPVEHLPATTLPPPTHPIAGTGNTVQKVFSKANPVSGTSVASAIAREKRAAVIQTVDTSGAKAIANAEAHKGAATNVQSVSANGTNVGIANAVVDNSKAVPNTRTEGPEVVLQNVAASGSKAVATAANNKGSGSGVQQAEASGDELSIASVTSAREKRETLLLQPVVVPDDGLYRPNPFEDDGSYKQHEKILIRHRVARSPCISTKMDNSTFMLIRKTVIDAFLDLKKEMKLI